MRNSIRFVAVAAVLLFSEKAIAAAPSLQEVRAQNFEVISMTGAHLPLAELLPEGQPVVVEFWATWCAPCRKTVPLLVELFARHENAGISILGLNIENPVNDLDKVRKFLSDEGVSYPVVFVSQELFEFMNEQDEPGVPKLLVYDASGNLVEHILRYGPFTKRRLRKAVRQARRGE